MVRLLLMVLLSAIGYQLQFCLDSVDRYVLGRTLNCESSFHPLTNIPKYRIPQLSGISSVDNSRGCPYFTRL